MAEAWQSGLTGRGVCVAIVDSGLSNLTMDIDRSRIEESVNLSPVTIKIGSPVLWAQKSGLVTGFPDASYRTDAPVTREQLATILHRYAMWKGLPTGAGTSPSFADFSSVSGWAKDAMQWATYFGVMKGDAFGLLNPTSSATRAEVSTMLMNFDSCVR